MGVESTTAGMSRYLDRLHTLAHRAEYDGEWKHRHRHGGGILWFKDIPIGTIGYDYGPTDHWHKRS